MAINWLEIILIAIGIAVVLTAIVIPEIIHVSLVKRLFDKPDKRKIHNGIIPRLGGLAFLPVALITFCVVLIMTGGESAWGNSGALQSCLAFVPSAIVLFGAMMLLFLVGLADDLIGLRYSIKLVVQILSGVLIVTSGFYIPDFYGIFGIYEVDPVIGGIITCFLIVYIINAINLIDGLDGLAAGLSIITFVLFGTVLFTCGSYLYSALAWIGAATTFVFFLFNVFGRKSRHTKIFMGDIGSLTIGLYLAFISVAVMRLPENDHPFFNILTLAFAPFLIPLFDVIRVFIIRIMKGRSPFLPDKNHIHHRLLAAGLSPAGVLVTLLVAEICFIAINIYLSYVMNINWILAIDLAIYIIGIIIIENSIGDKPANLKASKTN